MVFCNTILIGKVFNENSAILLQNTFATLEKFNNLIKLHKRGIKVFFTDIDKIKEQMLGELK